MSAPVVFDTVWKKFRQGERHDSLRDLLPATINALTKRKPADELKAEEFWALKNVSFEVSRGQALGIIGPNGAGKSTTLKLLTRILRPNIGRCALSGRVGALIEVAAGFHPDLTGRENTYLQGAIMGMRRAEVNKRFDEIVEFAGVASFIDTQTKRYSSGMNARLGFSIAAHLSPDVLIIDEVLSVGDMAFQEKCLERMRQFKNDGVTIVFVSHNLQAVAELCDQALYLKREVRAFGPCPEVINAYVNDSFAAAPESDGEIRVVSVELRHMDQRRVLDPVSPGTPLTIRAEYDVIEDIDDVTFTFVLHRATDQLLVYNRTFDQRELGLGPLRAGRLTVDFQFDVHLTRGQYYFDLFARHVPSLRYLGRLRPAAHLTVAENVTYAGVADVDARASARLVSVGSPSTPLEQVAPTL